MCGGCHRVIQLFLSGRHADLIGQTVSIRAGYLADIASLYSKSDLLCEQGIGRTTVARIEQWLAAQDRRFRAPDETVAEVICRFRPRSAQSAVRRGSRLGGSPFWKGLGLTGRMKRCTRFEAPNSTKGVGSAAWSLSKHP